ncbi:MAG: valine--tRNA ligase [Christensenellaceae bacterium]|nr:valine--tRNA ligase [Christensenellaceae bacterium]
METNMAKSYSPKDVEERLYKEWMEKGYFHAHAGSGKPPYTIVIPPPNITGQLHMGHALDETIQDAVIRMKRMQGYEALWLPGTDHASIATEVKIVDAMAKEGLTKEMIGREEFLKRSWKWKEQYGGRIVSQLKKLGSSCDWDRERFTMDEGCSRAVREVFVKLYEKGLIYKGNRIINWCPNCETALSDAEVEYEEQDSHLWHIFYRCEDGEGGITIATTRPETMLGDTAVAVHPDDERYKSMIGKNLILPIMNKPIPVVADEYVEKEFGTGAVKITPAHDPNDFEVAQRHGLPVIRVMTDDGLMNENAGKYAGIPSLEAREKIVEELKDLGVLVKIEPYRHNVGTCYRCHATVEPLVSEQWFVAMKDLVKPALEAVRSGETTFIPKRYEKIYFNWLENIKDWCISRQLWWGHRIPAYYCDKCGHMTIAVDAPECCPECGSKDIRQDEDVLDTWFSSGLWPFSTLGWPDDTEDLRYFYPTTTLVTGYDIIFFWVARMMVFGKEIMGDAPFKNVSIHGIVRDSQGRKMSKSLGNGIDPLEVIDKHGADALRFSLVVGNAAGSDMRFYWEKVESAGNFANKIWNAARFLLMNSDGIARDIDTARLDIADKWILSRLNDIIREVTDCMDRFELGLAAQKVYDFIWSEYCDWYIEMAKPRLYGDDEEDKHHVLSVLTRVLMDSLKLLHPFMPFLTEEIYRNLPGADETIMLSSWPVYDGSFTFEKAESDMEIVMDAIRQIRQLRSSMNVPPSRRAELIIRTDRKDSVEACRAYLLKLAFGSDVRFAEAGQSSKGFASCVCELGEIFMPVGELVDIDKESERLLKEKDRLTGEIARAEGKLSNERFVAKAPEHVVNEERQKLASYKEMLEKILARIAEFEELKN